MTRDTVRARQSAQPATSALQVLRVTVVTVTPLTVRLPGGAVAAGIKVAGLTYTANGAADALYQEPAVFSVFPRA